MKKIPTIFVRDSGGKITDEWHMDCLWVREGQGVPMQKLDGTCCLLENEVLWKRRMVKVNTEPPDGFRFVQYDGATFKSFGWVRVSANSKADQYHREGIQNSKGLLVDGTYELIGPKIQGNPERSKNHTLVSHFSPALQCGDIERSFDSIRDYFNRECSNIEGIVWHRGDGLMAKIKGKDFGIERTA